MVDRTLLKQDCGHARVLRVIWHNLSLTNEETEAQRDKGLLRSGVIGQTSGSWVPRPVFSLEPQHLGVETFRIKCIYKGTEVTLQLVKL